MTGVELPALGSAAVDVAALGPPVASPVEWRDEQGQVIARGQAHVDGSVVELVRVARYAWLRDGSEVAVSALAGAAPDEVAEGFERFALPMLLQQRGIESLHASAVAGSAGVVALCGVAGTGKSSLAAGLAT